MGRPPHLPIPACLILALALTSGCGPGTPPEREEAGSAVQSVGVAGVTHQELVAFFQEWREFQHPEVVDGVPDYSADAMAEQHRRLADYRVRLAAFDTTGWSVADQIDVHVIRAEMNGLDFDHRVLRPWARNPAFYMMIFTAQS
ncbi:MAG: hypothetical protein ABIF09_11165, partial [Gemmatimonadota bacterium]